MGRLTADLVTISHYHPGHSTLSAFTNSPKIIDGPGEYEVGGVIVTGFPTYHDSEKGKLRGKNTAYLIEFEDLKICHLGDLGHVLTTAQIDQLSRVDVLLVPVGGEVTINAGEAAEVISVIEPKIIIPMHYRLGPQVALGGAELDTVERFLKQMGQVDLVPQPKLNVSAGNLPDEAKVIVLSPRGA